MLLSTGICTQYTHATNENRHLRRRQSQQLRLVDQQLLGRNAVDLFLVVPETISNRLQVRKRLDIRLFCGCIHASRREGHCNGNAGILRGFLNRRTAAENNQVRQRYLFPAGLRVVECLLYALQLVQNPGKLLRIVDIPILLRRQTNASAVCTTALVGSPERGGGRPGGRHQFRNRQPRIQDALLQFSNIALVDERMVNFRDRILPDKFLFRDFGTEVPGTRAHVTVRQLEPGACEGISKFVRVLHEPPGNLLVRRIETQRQVGRQHLRRDPLRRVVGMRDRSLTCTMLGTPLVGSRRTLLQLPFKAEEIPEKVVTPLGRRRRPGHLEAARDRVAAYSRAEAARPSETLFRNARTLRFNTDMRRRSSAVRLSKRMSAGNECHRFFVVHRHTRKRLADVDGGLHGIRLAVRSFRIHVNKTHLHRRERVFQIALSRVTVVVEPRLLRAPVHVLIRLPDIRTAAGKTKRLEAHRFEGHVTGENHQIRPRNLATILLFDRPQQAASLVQADVVRPAIERCKSLLTASAAAATVSGAIRTRAVPRHANKQRTVVPEICRPPVLRIRHHRRKVLLDGSEVELLELLRVIKVLTHRIRAGRMLIQKINLQLIRPPVAVRRTAACRVVERALR